nr:c-type cytochrome [uncultured Cupriavidus sp.]
MSKKALLLCLLFTGAALSPCGPSVSAAHAATSSSEETCRACHTLDTAKIGPPFRAIAARYRDDASAVDTLTKSMLQGSSGKWGATPMPPNAISPAEAVRFAHWVLQLAAPGPRTP